MHIEQLREYCITKKGVTEHFPFNETTLVFKVMGKMFIMIGLDRWEEGKQNIILKLEPELAIKYRESNNNILAGYQQGRKLNSKFVNVKHWNTIITNEGISKELVLELINEAYKIVVKGLTKKLKEELKNL